MIPLQDLSSLGSLLIYISLVFLAVGVAMLIVFFAKRIAAIFSRTRGRPKRRVGVVASFVRLLLILLFISAASTLLFFWDLYPFLHRLYRAATCGNYPLQGDASGRYNAS